MDMVEEECRRQEAGAESTAESTEQVRLDYRAMTTGGQRPRQGHEAFSSKIQPAQAAKLMLPGGGVQAPFYRGFRIWDFSGCSTTGISKSMQHYLSDLVPNSKLKQYKCKVPAVFRADMEVVL